MKTRTINIISEIKHDYTVECKCVLTESGKYPLMKGYYWGAEGEELQHTAEAPPPTNSDYCRHSYRWTIYDESLLTLENNSFDKYNMSVRIVYPISQDPNITIIYYRRMSNTSCFIDPSLFDSSNGAVYAAVTFQRIDGQRMTDEDLQTLENDFKIYYKENHVVTLNSVLVPGSLMMDDGTMGKIYNDGFFRYHTSKHPVCVKGCSRIMFRLSEEIHNKISGGGFYFYKIVDGIAQLVERVSLSTIKQTGQDSYSVSMLKNSEYEYLLVCLDFGQDNSIYEDVPITYEAHGNISNVQLVNMFNIPNNEEITISFNYKVSHNTWTNGRLILPPNYTVDGPSVPLLVSVHGTGGLTKWTSLWFDSDGHDATEVMKYRRNEGFAIFDCYPWTSKYYKDSRQISPFALDVHIRAYIEGVKFVCDRWNIDINNVFMMCKSLGGTIGYYMMNQTELPIRGIAMMAPGSGFISTIWSQIFLESNARRAILEVLKLENEPDAQTFINTNRGLIDATCMNFVRTHLDRFIHLIGGTASMIGMTASQKLEGVATGTTEEPQWMIDENIPKWPSNWEAASYAFGPPEFIHEPNHTRFSLYPVAFWASWDDINTSTHSNYTIHKWLINGGSDSQFNILPSGTGGHWSMDTAVNAIKVSGTTHIGISYTNVAKGQVDAFNWFYSLMLS